MFRSVKESVVCVAVSGRGVDPVLKVGGTGDQFIYTYMYALYIYIYKCIYIFMTCIIYIYIYIYTT